MLNAIKNILLRREDFEKVLSDETLNKITADLARQSDIIYSDEGLKFIWVDSWCEPETESDETEEEVERDPDFDYSCGQYKDIIEWFNKERM